MRVGRDVRPRLEHLAGVQLKRRCEERIPALIGREIRHLGADAAHILRVFRPGPVDEAGLADAGRIELLEVIERNLGLPQSDPVRLHLLCPRTRFRVEVAERGIVGSQQHDRARPLEIRTDPARILVGGGRQGVIDDQPLLTVLAHPEGGPTGNQQNRHDQRQERRRAHWLDMGASPGGKGRWAACR
jgi:hypothetical protein